MMFISARKCWSQNWADLTFEFFLGVKTYKKIGLRFFMLFTSATWTRYLGQLGVRMAGNADRLRKPWVRKRISVSMSLSWGSIDEND